MEAFRVVRAVVQPGRDPQSRQRGSPSRPRVRLPVPSELKRDA